MNETPIKENPFMVTNKEANHFNVSVINSKLLFTQLGVTLYQNNSIFRDIQIRKLKNVSSEASSIFIYISTVNKHAQKIETDEFRRNIQVLKTAIYQDERLVAVSLYPQKCVPKHNHYIMYQYPIGVELFLFGSILSQSDTYNHESHEISMEIKDNLETRCNTDVSDNDSSISLESFHISDEDWNLCASSSTTSILNEPIRYWCVFPLECNKYSDTQEKEIKDLFYSVLNFRMKTILQIAPNVCYRIVFQHPLLNPCIREPRIYIMEANKILNHDIHSQTIHDHNSQDIKHDDQEYDTHSTKIYRCDRDICEIMQYINTLDDLDPIKNLIQVPKYIGSSKSLVGVYEKCLCQPIHISGISITDGQYDKIVYHPFRRLQTYTLHMIGCIRHTYANAKNWIQTKIAKYDRKVKPNGPISL